MLDWGSRERAAQASALHWLWGAGLYLRLGWAHQPRDALVVSRHGEEKQSNTLKESNTIQTLVSILCPRLSGVWC